MTDQSSRLAAFDAIPVIDISGAKDLTERPRLARRLTGAAEEVGFVYVTGHADASTVLDALFAQMRAFFELPAADKRKVGIRRSPAFRGYLGLLEKGDDPSFKGNFLEAFHVGEDLPADDPDATSVCLRGPNLWPDAPAGFRDVVYGYFESTFGVGRVLLELLAEGMGLPSDFFTRHYAHSIAQLRLLRYAQQDDPSIELLARAHRDAGVITLLCQDDTGGLEVENRAGDWIAVPPLTGAYVVNIGNTLEFWTGGRLTSTNHRVRNCRNRAPRYSIPFFMTPGFDTMIRAIGTEGNPDAPSLHVGDAMLQTYRRIWPSVENPASMPGE